MDIKVTVCICPVCGIFYIEENPRFLCDHLTSWNDGWGISHTELTEEGRRGIKVLTQMRYIPPKLEYVEGIFTKKNIESGDDE